MPLLCFLWIESANTDLYFIYYNCIYFLTCYVFGGKLKGWFCCCFILCFTGFCVEKERTILTVVSLTRSVQTDMQASKQLFRLPTATTSTRQQLTSTTSTSVPSCLPPHSKLRLFLPPPPLCFSQSMCVCFQWHWNKREKEQHANPPEKANWEKGLTHIARVICLPDLSSDT